MAIIKYYSDSTDKKSSGSKTGNGISTMRGTGTGSTSKSYADTLKGNITNSVKNPSNGVYSSLSNNSMIKDMETAYKSSGGNKTDNSIEAYLSQYGINNSTSNEYKPNYGDMGDKLEYNPYEEAYRESQKRIEEMEAQIREQNRLAVEQGTNRLNAQKTNINQAADENARQAYVQYMQSQKALPQQLASQGVSGGATETANLGLQTAYQNNVNTINQNKANRLQEIDNAIVDLQNTGDLSTVEQVLANNQAALDAYMNTFDKGVGYNQWANQFNRNNKVQDAQLALEEKAYADQLAQQQWENDWFEKQYNDEKKQAELDRTLQGYYNGYYDAGYTSAKTGIPIEYLYDTKSERELMAKLERANTQSLINNRNTQTVKAKEENAKEELGNKYYDLANMINNQYAGNATGKKAGDAVIIDDGNGGYTLNPDISRGSYLDLVIARALDSNMSDNEVKTFLNNLGINDSDISRVAAYYLK